MGNRDVRNHDRGHDGQAISISAVDDLGDYGLDYEDVTSQARDGVRLRGWVIKGGTDKVIIQSQIGVKCNRAGYCPDGKGLVKPWKRTIGFPRQDGYLADIGYSVLMYDLRGHGQSDAGDNKWVSWRPEEAKDVIAAVDSVSNHPAYKSASTGLLPISMGGRRQPFIPMGSTTDLPSGETSRT